jgi:hypothetical protein
MLQLNDNKWQVKGSFINFKSSKLSKAMSTNEDDHYFSSLHTSSTPLALNHFLIISFRNQPTIRRMHNSLTSIQPNELEA